jgi:hypothetical protein
MSRLAAVVVVAAVAAVPVAATTTFRSRSSRVAIGFCVSLGFLTASCRREQEPPAPVRTHPVPRPETPRALLARGTVRNPASVWRALRPALSGKARLLPVTPELAVTTLPGFSPLVAGLIEASAPAPFDVLARGDLGLEIVAGIRATSATELVVAVSSGAEAKFAAEVDAERGITLLHPRDSSADVRAAVAGDYLVLGSGTETLRAASAHVATAPILDAPAGDVAEMLATHAELDGPLEALVTRIGAAARARLETSDADNRLRHGGRAPDFADPAPVIAALGMLTERVADVLSSTSRMRATVKVEPAPSLRVELVPEERGAARDFSKELPRGDLSLLAHLPGWADLSFMWHRRESPADPFIDRIAALFGDRIGSADRRRIAGWADELDRGLGRTAVVGLFGESTSAGVFVVATGGDGRALRRATSGIADVARVTALRSPIEAFFGRLKCTAREGSLAGLPVTRLSLELSASARAPIRAVAAAKDDLGAIVFGSGDVDARLLDLIDARGRTSLGADETFAAVAARVQSTAAYAGSVRLRVGPRGEREIAVFSAGADDELLWLDARASAAALRALLSEDGAFAGPP